MIQIIARHMVGGYRHEHIAEVKWQDVGDGSTGRTDRSDMVEWLDKSDANQAVVGNYPQAFVHVGTVHPQSGDAYIRTYANREWTDNLLSLPEY